MQSNYFTACETLQELREQYKRLAKIYHPDISGFNSTEEMKQINNEFDHFSNLLAAGSKFTASEIQFSEIFKEKIIILIKLDGIIIEIIGNWLWLTGNTKAHKETIKSLGFFWSKKKTAWYFKNYKYYKKGKERELNEIRNMYGSTTVKNYSNQEENNLITA